ncbi:hypothetical protein [Niastella populi]|uniref:Uncharacterized protein n=1 Tax=Niastella populi TaxID=550983 RepID=A0A1V9EKC4_9BACT|nr:hypothetical protein [Niastella populi]OQP46589.1 hypothetical protein A4R26_07605 [Niastella populi]
MKNPQPTPGEDKKEPFLHAKDAETAFIQFIRQLNQKQAKGFISESGQGKIFSFESWLRENGHMADVIAGYCEYAKTVNMLEMLVRKRRKFSIFNKEFLKVLLFFTGVLVVPALLIYLLAAMLLPIFGVSLWNGKAFLSFTGIGVVVMFVFFQLKPRKKQAQKGQTDAAPRPLFIIKYFDNEELVFAKAKSRLFVG